MITNVSTSTLHVTDQERARRFYTEHFGFEVRTDVQAGGGRRWLTLGHPAQPELEIALIPLAPPLSQTLSAAIGAELAAGTMFGIGLHTDDCQADYERLSAEGVRFLAPPAPNGVGIEAVLVDDSGNRLFLFQAN